MVTQTPCAGTHRRRPARLVLALALALLATAGVLATPRSIPPAAAEPTGTRPLLVILLERTGGPGLAHDNQHYDRLVFGGGGARSVTELYNFNSRNRFTYSRAGLLRVRDRNDPDLGTPSGNDLKGLVHGINLAGEADFTFARYDTNGDGIVRPHELTVLVIDNYSESAGATRNACQRPPDAQGRAQSVQYCGNRAAAGHRSSLTNIAHELAHTLEPQAQDLYGENCRSYRFTVMSCTVGEIDQRPRIMFDPWHRIQYGWITAVDYQPLDWPISGAETLNLQPSCRASRVAVILRPPIQNRPRERFIIENRQRCPGDDDVHATGIVVWFQRDDPNKAIDLYSAPDTNIVINSLECVYSAYHLRNRTNPTGATSGRHRLWWGDGQDSQTDLVIGKKAADGTIPLTIRRVTLGNSTC